MAYESPDFKAIADGAKKSPKFREMTGEPSEPDADDEGGGETADLGDAFAASQSGDEDAFKASMLAAIKSCIASYGKK